MKINDSNSLGNVTPAQTGRAAQTQSVPSTGRTGVTGRTGSTGDSVELSGFAGKIRETLASGETSRAQHVSQIAAAVRNGTYKVDAKAVSRALVDNAISGGGNE